MLRRAQVVQRRLAPAALDTLEAVAGHGASVARALRIGRAPLILLLRDAGRKIVRLRHLRLMCTE